MARSDGQAGGNKEAAAHVLALLRRVCPNAAGAARGDAGKEWEAARGEAALRELQRVLLEPAALADMGAGGIEGALARMMSKRAHAQETVSVIMSSLQPHIVDSGDCAMRRLSGARAAERVRKAFYSVWFGAPALAMTVICAVLFPLAFLGMINSIAALAALVVQFGLLLLVTSVMVSLPLLRLLATRFEPYFILGHSIVAGVGGFVLNEDPATAWLWLLTLVLLFPLGLTNDAIAVRSSGLLAYLAMLVAMVGVLGGILWDSFPLRQAALVVLAESLPVKDRVAASLFCCILYTARFVATLYWSPGRFFSRARASHCATRRQPAPLSPCTRSSRGWLRRPRLLRMRLLLLP